MNSKRIETEEKIQAVPGIPCRPGIERKGRTYVFTAEVFPESKAELLLYERKDGEKILTVFPFPEESRQGNLLSLQVTGLTGTEVWYNFHRRSCAARPLRTEPLSYAGLWKSGRRRTLLQI